MTTTTPVYPFNDRPSQREPVSNIKSRRTKENQPTSRTKCRQTFALGAFTGALIVAIPLAVVVILWQAPSITTKTALSDTSTSSTTTTSMTTASSTTATTATTTTSVTTTPNPCTNSNATGSNYLSPGMPLLYTYTVPMACSSYFQVAWLYIAQSTNETLTISIYNNPATTKLDDVSVIDTNTSQQLISNGGFENGTTSWSGTALGFIGQSGGCHTGAWCYSDASVNANHYVAQSFLTTIGHTLLVSFYIQWSGSGAGVYNNITITP